MKGVYHTVLPVSLKLRWRKVRFRTDKKHGFAIISALPYGVPELIPLFSLVKVINEPGRSVYKTVIPLRKSSLRGR